MYRLKNKFKHKLAYFIYHLNSWAESIVLAKEKEDIKKILLHCGKRVHFHGRITITFPENCQFDDNVIIGNNAYIDGRGGITIGENTHISRNFVAHSSSHNYQSSRLPYDETYDLKPIVIGKNVWIGTNVVIVPGISIGDGAIIGAGTVVSKSIPELAIVGNQPTRLIKYRDEAHYSKLNIEKAYGGISGRVLKE